MKWMLLVAALLLLAIALAALVGAWLPRTHVATRRATFARTPAQLYGVVRDFAAAPSWRTGVKTIELLPPREGRVAYRETRAHGPITYLVREDRPGEKLVTAIADPDLPFGGTWTFEFAPAAGGAGGTVRITEHGEVKNVLFRFLSRFVFGHASTMETYLRDLGRKFGEATQPEP